MSATILNLYQRLSSGFVRPRVDNLCGNGGCSNLAASAVAEAVSMNKFWFGGCMQKTFIRRPKNLECTNHYGVLWNSYTIMQGLKVSGTRTPFYKDQK